MFFTRDIQLAVELAAKQDSPVTTTKPSDELLEDLICKVHVFFDKILNRL